MPTDSNRSVVKLETVVMSTPTGQEGARWQGGRWARWLKLQHQKQPGERAVAASAHQVIAGPLLLPLLLQRATAAGARR